MLLSHPTMRHSFVEEAGALDDEDFAKLSTPAATLNANDAHLITPDSFERIQVPENYQFKGLGQITEGQEPVALSAIGVLASIPRGETDDLENRRNRYREQADTGARYDKDEYWKSPHFPGSYKRMQELVEQHVTPAAMLRHKDTGKIFEVYKHDNGFLYVGASPSSHESDALPGTSHSQLEGHGAGAVDPITGTSIAIPSNSKNPASREALEQAHDLLPAHTHPIDWVKDGRVYSIATTPQGRMLAPAPVTEAETPLGVPLTGVSSVAPFLHSILSKANALPSQQNRPSEQTEMEPAKKPTRKEKLEFTEDEIAEFTEGFTPDQRREWLIRMSPKPGEYSLPVVDQKLRNLRVRREQEPRDQQGLLLDPKDRRTEQKIWMRNQIDVEQARTDQEATRVERRKKEKAEEDKTREKVTRPKNDHARAVQDWLSRKPHQDASDKAKAAWWNSKPVKPEKKSPAKKSPAKKSPAKSAPVKKSPKKTPKKK